MNERLPIGVALTRSLAQEGMHVRAVRYSETTYSAFQVGDDEGGKFPQRTYTHGEMLSASLDEAVTEALTRAAFDHKDHLVIREVGPRGMKLHVFAIKKQARPTYVHTDHVTRREHKLYAAKVCTIDGGVLAG